MDDDKLQMVTEGVARFATLLEGRGVPVAEVLGRPEPTSFANDMCPSLTAVDKQTTAELKAFIKQADGGLGATSVFARERMLKYIDADDQVRTILLAALDPSSTGAGETT